MPRRARIVIPGAPHHVTQRGNRRERVFHTPADAGAYLDLLHKYAVEFSIEIVAYCLMPNHVHIVLVPRSADALHRALKALHGRYAQRVNRLLGHRGHVWQDRYFSSPLDAGYFANAVRYVELNPVRAGMVARAEDFRWSSAQVHCGLVTDRVIGYRTLSAVLGEISNWSGWLAEGVPNEALVMLRRNAGQNLPCGSEEFIASLETACGCALRYRPRGGQSKETKGTLTFRR
jgi:putative transposase